MLSLPFKPRQLTGPLLLLLFIVVAQLFTPDSYKLLAYHRDAITDFQWWRLFTAHLLHTNLNHLLLNGAGVILLWAVFGEYYRLRQYLSIVFACALGISVGLYWQVPELSWYVGLSGVLHGLFVCGAISDIHAGRRSGWLLLIGVAVKVGYEMQFGGDQTVSALIDARVAVEAHLFGAISGLLISLPTLFYLRADGPSR
ncbi:rhombosortase [Lacimicrobium alkaliphilum]|uniref:Rhombosortase n=1 Tax=Lacimicrobium alkaliphilum TaxID=1526571 RepID=A0ABQ1RJ95_9ALTE|nr:rhombosortase [Lacimicrobium alkaliphilum]GGD68870.1 rhombosortase [Lacimicrobium alkaliphilum]